MNTKDSFTSLRLKAFFWLKKEIVFLFYKFLPFLYADLQKCQLSRVTPFLLHQYMVRQYTKSNGRFQDKLFKKLCYESADDSVTIILSALEECLSCGVLFRSHIAENYSTFDELIALKRNYIANGYVVFPYVCNHSFIERSLDYLTTSETLQFSCRTHDQTMDRMFDFRDIPTCAITAKISLSDISNRMDKEFLANNFQALDRLFHLLSKYLMDSKSAIKKHSSVWWTFPARTASSECAQLFHFDCDSLKWIKFFTYLSDVDESNGPHVAITRTHLPGTKSQLLLNQGYVRHIDHDVLNSLEEGQKLVEFCSPRGTIIIADTRCWHKGSTVKNGKRIIMDFVFLSHEVSREVI